MRSLIFFFYLKINHVLAELDLSQKEIDLLDWVKENGAQISSKINLELITENNRGFFATKEISEGDELMFIPDQMLIEYEDASIHVHIDVDQLQRGVDGTERKYLHLPIVPLTLAVFLM